MEPYPAFLGGLHLALEGGTKKKKVWSRVFYEYWLINEPPLTYPY